MYNIIGSDGKTYGPVTAGQIREWVAQGRADARTAVIAEGASEWTFLGLLPDFAHELAGTTPATITPLPSTGGSTASINGFAITGFIFGLIALPVFFCCCGCPFNLLGLIFSGIALAQINGQTQKQAGWGLALAGLICSVLSLVMGIVFFIWRSFPSAGGISNHFGAM